MFKKLLFLFLSIGASTQAMVYLPSGVTQGDVKAHALKKKVIIAYDIHDVLAVKDNGSKVKTIIKHLPSIVVSKVTDSGVWKEINQVKKAGSSGQGYEQVFQKHGNNTLAKMAQEAANAYRPRRGMATIVHEMKLMGHTQRFASNIGDQFLVNLKNRFRTKYKIQMLDMIDQGKVVDCSQFGAKPLPKPLPKHLASVAKPSPLFFQEFIDAWNAQHDNLIVFMDDKLENIKAAVAKGYVGIHVNPKWDDATFTKNVRTAYQSLGLYAK